MLLPRVQLARLVHRAFYGMEAAGTVEVMGKVVLALPLQLDRLAGFHHIVVHQPPAEAAAAAGLMDHDIVVRQTGHRRHHTQSAIGLLSGRPDLQHAVMPVGGGVHRLQRCVRHKAVVIISVQGFGRIGEGGVDIADIDAGLVGEVRRDFLGLGFGSHAGVFRRVAFVPVHLQRILGFEGRPGGVGDDGDARHHLHRLAGAFHHKGIQHARHFLDLGFIEA